MTAVLAEPARQQVARYLHLFGGTGQFESALQVATSGHPLGDGMFYALHRLAGGNTVIFLSHLTQRLLFAALGLHHLVGCRSDSVETETIDEVEDGHQDEDAEEGHPTASNEDGDGGNERHRGQQDDIHLH